MNLAAITQRMPCPVCGLTGGFHDSHLHSLITVPKELTWKTGEVPSWRRQSTTASSVEPIPVSATNLSILPNQRLSADQLWNEFLLGVQQQITSVMLSPQAQYPHSRFPYRNKPSNQ